MSAQLHALLLFEIVANVLARLGPKALHRASQTCAAWRAIVDATPWLWRDCFLRHYGRPKLPLALYSNADFKRILLYKIFRERVCWRGLAANKPRKLRALSDYVHPRSKSLMSIGRSTIAYHQYVRPISEEGGPDAVDYLRDKQAHILSTTSSDGSVFPVPMEYVPVIGDGVELAFAQHHRVRMIQVSDNFVAVATSLGVRVYPSALHSHPYRIDLHHDAPFKLPTRLSFQKDVLAVTWVPCPHWRAQHLQDMPHHIDSRVCALRIYNFQHFWPEFSSDRFTVFTHQQIPFCEVLSPFEVSVHSSLEFSNHLTDLLAQNYNQQQSSSSINQPFIKVAVDNNYVTDMDDEFSLAFDHRIVVFTFNQQLKLIGIRQYENSSKNYSTPLSYCWSIHGHYLISYLAVHDIHHHSNTLPGLSLHLEDSHTAGLPNSDILKIITNVTASHFTSVELAFKQLGFTQLNTLLQIPCRQLPFDDVVSSLLMIGNHLVTKEWDYRYISIKVFDIHTWKLITSRRIGKGKWDHNSDTYEITPCPGSILETRLSDKGVYIIHAITSHNIQLEYLPYALQQREGENDSFTFQSRGTSTQQRYTQLVKSLSGKPGKRRGVVGRNQKESSRSTRGYGVDEFDDVLTNAYDSDSDDDYNLSADDSKLTDTDIYPS